MTPEQWQQLEEEERLRQAGYWQPGDEGPPVRVVQVDYPAEEEAPARRPLPVSDVPFEDAPAPALVPPQTDLEKQAAALEFARKEAEKRQGWADIMEGGAQIARGISGHDYDRAYFDRLRERAGQPLKDEEARQKLARDYAAAVAQGREKEFFNRLRAQEAASGEQKAKAYAADVANRPAREKARLEEVERQKREEREWKEEQNRLGRESNERAAAIASGRVEDRQIRAEKRAEERQEDKEQRKSAEKKQQAAQDVESFARNIENNLAALESNIKKFGTFEATGPATGEQDALITAYAIDMAKLMDPGSVAREGEVAMQQKSLWKPGVGGLALSNDTALQLIRQARARVRQRVAEAYRLRGLEVPERWGGRPAVAGENTKQVGGKTYRKTAEGWELVP